MTSVRIIASRPNVDPAPPAGDDLVLDYAKHRIGRCGRWIRFPPGQFRILAPLVVAWAVRPHRIVPVADLVEAVWGDDANGGPTRPANTASVHLTKAKPQLDDIGLALAPPLWGHRAIVVREHIEQDAA